MVKSEGVFPSRMPEQFRWLGIFGEKIEFQNSGPFCVLQTTERLRKSVIFKHVIYQKTY